MGSAAQRITPLAAWSPQAGPQRAYIRCPVFEVFYGGARGGGKTDAALGEWAIHANRYGRNAIGVFFRRELPQLEEVIARSQDIYGKLGARWNDQKKTWFFLNGARLKFRPLERDKDAEKYQGHSYTRVYCEELSNWPNYAPIGKLMATLRSAKGVPCRFRATGNPGGPGHQWVKARYIDPAPPYKVIREGGLERVFIPAKIKDNPQLLKNDPDYVKRIRQSGSAELVRAWLEGDWDIVAGGMFDDLWQQPTHVIKPFQVPRNWRVDRGFDWGSSKPFAVLWFAESNGEQLEDGRAYPRGSIIVIAEWYGWNGKPNEGCRMIASEIARGVLERERFIKAAVRPGPADSAIYAVQNGKSIADDMALAGVKWEPSDKGKGSRVNGWERMREMLRNATTGEGPGLYIFETCRHAIRTLPVAPRDERNTDDLDTDSEDHILDTIRYRVSHKPAVTRSTEVAL